MSAISGVWLPIITPFVDGVVDLAGYERLLGHYLSTGIAGIFPVGTTGESPTLDDDETERIVERTLEVVRDRLPVFVGVGGNATAKVVTTTGRARTASTRTSARSPRPPTARSSSTTSRTAPA